MATTEINIMFLTPGGFDGHVKILCEDGEKLLPWLERAEKQLLDLGCRPRQQTNDSKGYQGKPQPQQTRQQERPTPIRPAQQQGGQFDADCPKCGKAIEEKWGQSKQTGRPWHGLFCSNHRCDYKEWLNTA